MYSDLPNLKALDLFVQLAQKRFINDVARDNHISASAVSQALTRLESQWGEELFVRDTRPLQLTPAGQALLREAVPLLEQARAIRRQCRIDWATVKTLRLGLSESVTATISPWLIAKLSESVERLDTVSMLTRPLVEALTAGHVDAAIVPDGLLWDDRWHREALYSEDFLVISAKSHKTEGPLNVESLCDRPFVGYSRMGSSDELEVERILRSLNLKLGRRVEVSSSYALVGLVSELDAWSIVPPTNVWCGRQFAHRCRIDTLPTVKASRTMWALCAKAQAHTVMPLISKTVREIVSGQMLPELSRAGLGLEKHVRLLP